ncbi:hypothetical protein AB5J62_15270 [Amycolatopsis sp. cg5]|uniref:hypothetical protein n=1 Tax=Amycolatopsis sp. cg5 TaxID=3238802 RepID=UPI0035249086
MAKQTIIWTVLPVRGPSTGQLKLSVFLTFRLTPDANRTLGAFGDLADWAAVPITWAVSVNGTEVPATETSTRDTSLWTKVFPASTPVTPYGMDTFSDKANRSYPVSKVHDFVKREYRQIAVGSPTAPVHLDTLVGPPGQPAGLGKIGGIAQEGEGRDTAIGSLEESYVESSSLPRKGIDNTPMDFTMADQFFDRRRTEAPKNTVADVPPVPMPALDFHQLVSSLGEHPQVLRRLGLLRDLVFTPPAGVTSPMKLQVVPTFPHAPGVSTEDIRPITNAVTENGVFGPGARGGGLAKGVLPLATDDFHTTSVDVDSAAAKVISFVTVANRVQTSLHLPKPAPGEPPKPPSAPLPPGQTTPPK